MKLAFFRNKSDLRKWFEQNHEKEAELFLGYYKTTSGKESISWPESVDEALCFGWIDGVRKSIDKESYFIRFTKRKSKSIWSAVNIKKIEELSRLGLMYPAGVAAFEKRDEKNSKIYSYEKEPVKLNRKYEKKLKANKKAWKFFVAQPPSYRKPAINWVMSAKQEATRVSRLETLIADCEAGQKIKPMRYEAKKYE